MDEVGDGAELVVTETEVEVGVDREEEEVAVAVGAADDVVVVVVAFGSVPNATERKMSFCAPSVHP